MHTLELYYSLAHPFQVVFNIPSGFLKISAPDPQLGVVVQRQIIVIFSDFNIHTDNPFNTSVT